MMIQVLRWLLHMQYCDGGPLDQAIRNTRFKRTMVWPHFSLAIMKIL